MTNFNKLKIVVLATTEQNTLKETIRILLQKCNVSEISEIVILMLSNICPSACVANEIIAENSSSVPISIHIQKTPGLYPAVYEATKLANNCTHFLIIGSDLEMDPNSVPKMIETAKKHPNAVVCASKFMKGSKLKNYGIIHYLGNRLTNLTVGIIAHIKGSEILSPFQIYPVDILKQMDFNSPYRTYYQYTIRPLIMGTEYIEVPTDYIRRSEGASNYNPKRYLDLSWTFIKTAFNEKKRKKSKAKYNSSNNSRLP